MEIAEMVLGRVNKNLVAMVQELGVPAAGISGKDGGLLQDVYKRQTGGCCPCGRHDALWQRLWQLQSGNPCADALQPDGKRE